MKKVLITGVAGFAGHHMTRMLSDEEFEIYGFDHSNNSPSAEMDSIDYHSVDIVDAKRVEDLILKIEPDYIYHLAALSSVARSWTDQQRIYQVNVIGQINVLSAAVKLSKKPGVMIACSSQEYGAVSPDELPLKEDADIRPDSPYAASKVCQDFIGLQYFIGFDLPVTRSRSFNHSGPLQSDDFVCSDFAKQIAMIEKGLRAAKIMVGNLEAKRDFTDVRDVVRAYKLIAENGKAGEAYNVCSGIAYSAGEILTMLLSHTDIEIEVEVDPAKNRPSDVPILVGDYSKIRKDVGWEPTIEMDKTLLDLLNWWRDRLVDED